MKKRRYWGIRAKIILCTVLCVVAVGLGSSLYLYQYMQRIISDKIAQIDQLNAGTITARLDDALKRECASAPSPSTTVPWETCPTC